jgi:hypothetical protein
MERNEYKTTAENSYQVNMPLVDKGEVQLEKAKNSWPADLHCKKC